MTIATKVIQNGNKINIQKTMNKKSQTDDEKRQNGYEK